MSDTANAGRYQTDNDAPIVPISTTTAAEVMVLQSDDSEEEKVSATFEEEKSDPSKQNEFAVNLDPVNRRYFVGNEL